MAQTVSFDPATNFAVGTSPFSVAIGDLNGDGKADLAVANFSSDTVSILLGTGTGSFSAATNFGVGSRPASVAIGDLNGDGKLDLAVAISSDNIVSIFLGDGTGSFSAATNFAAGPAPEFVAIGDLNGDGKLDLAVASADADSVSVLLGTGTGSFGSATTFPTLCPFSVAIGDLNGDGKPDLAASNSCNNSVEIFLGDGTGSFSAATNFAAGNGPFSVAIGDLNGDGKPDLAVANIVYSNNVSILLGDGTGSFSPATNFAVGMNPASVAIGDLNGDGKLDLAVANLNSIDLQQAGDQANVSTLLGDGAGSFGLATNFAVGFSPTFVAIGDLNGDGKPDLAVANRFSNDVSILLNTTVFPIVVSGLESPLAALVPEGDSVPLPGNAFKLGRTLPLKLQISSDGTPLTDAGSAPRIVGLVRIGDPPLDLTIIDLDAGQANDSGVLFRFEDGSWIYNLSTKGLAIGTYTITLEMPDGQRYTAGFVLR